MGPGASAASRLIPPEPTVGSTATTSTITPIPPIHWVVDRQKSSPFDVDSMSGVTVAPVVVKPEIDSNSASSMRSKCPVRT